MFSRHPVLAILSILYLGFVGWVTLDPSPPNPARHPLLRLALRWFERHEATEWITFDTVEFLANVALFVPIGVLVLLLLGRRWWWVGVVVGLVLTLCIEGAQQFLPARFPDVRDLVANTAGAAIGALLALLVTTPAAIRARTRHPAPTGG